MAEIAANSEPRRKAKRGGPGRPFTKGQSGNPKGRPAAMFSFSKYLRDFLYSDHPQAEEYNLKTMGKDKVKSQLDVIVRRLAKDDPKILLAYGFGKPIETHEIGGIEGAPVIKVRFANFDPNPNNRTT